MHTGSIIKQTTVVSGVREVAMQYKGIILDQYGVLHNGVTALDGAVECVRYLSKHSLRMVVLSNSTKRSIDAKEKLLDMGFPDVFAGVITSGEESYQYLKSNYCGKRCTFITWDGSTVSHQFVDGLNLEFVEPEEADFCLLHGSGHIVTGQTLDISYFEDGKLELILSFLERIVKSGLTTICCNPDDTVLTLDAKGQTCRRYPPGRISKYLKSRGLKVLDFGKPNKEHFVACLKLLQLETDTSSVCHCGDSLEHDIKGASNAGIDTLFIASGIHKDELNLLSNQGLNEANLQNLFENYECAAPTFSTNKFAW